MLHQSTAAATFGVHAAPACVVDAVPLLLLDINLLCAGGWPAGA
jgi:hypothetical protein